MTGRPDGAEHDALASRPDVQERVAQYARGFHMYDDPSSVRCYLGHCVEHGPWLELLMQSSDGETFTEIVHLAGRLDMSSDMACVRDGVQAVHFLALFLDRVKRKVVLEHGLARGRSHGHPVFTKPYHAFDDRVLPWDRDKGPPVLGKHLSAWIARHAAAVRSMGPVEAIECRLSARRERGSETYRCEFATDDARPYAIEFRVNGRRRLSTRPVEVVSVMEALTVLSHLLRELRLMVTLVREYADPAGGWSRGDCRAP